MNPADDAVRHDVLVALVWSCQNVALALLAWRLSNRLFPQDTLAGRLLHATVVGCAAIVVVLLALGAGGAFSGPVLLAGMSVAIAALFTLLRILPAPVLRSPCPESRPAEGYERARRDPGRILWTVLAALLVGHCLVNGLLRLPTDFDCLMYHLPLVNHWLQAENLYVPLCSHWANPANSELLAAWCVGPFSGDFFNPLNNLPIIVMWGAASLEFVRLLGVSGAWRHLSAAAALSVYTLLHESDDASNDLMVVSCFMAASVYLLRYITQPGPVVRLLFAVSLGLLYGVKYFAMGYAAVAFGAFGLCVLLSQGWRSAIRDVLLVGLLSLPFGVYWYIRNLVATGLPFWPQGDDVSLNYPDLASTSLYGNGDPRLWPFALHAVWRMCGPVHWVALAGGPVVLLLCLHRVLPPTKDSSGKRLDVRWMAVLVLLAGSAVVLWITPFLVEDQPGSLNHLRWAYTPARYGMCFLTMSVLTFLSLLHPLSTLAPPRIGNAITAVAAVAVMAQAGLRLVSSQREFDHLAAGLAGLIVALGLGGLTWLFRRLPAFAVVPLVFVLSGLAVSAGAGFLSHRWHSGLGEHFDARFETEVFDRLDDPAFDGQRICVFDYRPYPYFGSRRQHVIVNPRIGLVADDMLREIIGNNCQFAAALGEQGYLVNRYAEAPAFLRQENSAFRPFAPPGRVCVVALPPRPTTADPW